MNEKIIGKEEEVESFLIVSQGQFGVYQIEEKESILIATLEIGNYYGFWNILLNKKSPYEVKCLSNNSQIFLIDSYSLNYIFDPETIFKIKNSFQEFVQLTDFPKEIDSNVKLDLIYSLNPVLINKKKFIYHVGDISKFFYFIRQGEVVIENNENINYKNLKAGNFFGEEELLENSNRKFSAFCKRETYLYYIEKHVFLKIFT